jgi:hypothetical protein
MDMIFLALSVLSILVMFYALYNAFVLRQHVPGGKVKSTWNFLTGLIIIFSIGYLSAPFFRLLPREFKDVLVGVIFLAGAVFVLIVIKLFYKIVEDLGL